jgi:hypothetical protein
VAQVKDGLQWQAQGPEFRTQYRWEKKKEILPTKMGNISNCFLDKFQKKRILMHINIGMDKNLEIQSE